LSKIWNEKRNFYLKWFRKRFIRLTKLNFNWKENMQNIQEIFVMENSVQHDSKLNVDVPKKSRRAFSGFIRWLPCVSLNFLLFFKISILIIILCLRYLRKKSQKMTAETFWKSFENKPLYNSYCINNALLSNILQQTKIIIITLFCGNLVLVSWQGFISSLWRWILYANRPQSPPSLLQDYNNARIINGNFFVWRGPTFSIW
jgi:hypothetical protein